MKIGVDFDNTIVNHDLSFNKIFENYFEKNNTLKGYEKKNILKNSLSHKKWIKAQEIVYSEYIKKYGKVFNGFKKFSYRCKILGHNLEIVSHKSKLSFIKKFDLISPAKNFINRNIEIDKIFFFENLSEKINHINKSNYDFFIDDLPLVISQIKLPYKKRILFNRNYTKVYKGYLNKKNWREIEHHILNEPTNTEILFYIKEKYSNKKLKIVKKYSSNNSRVLNISDRKNYNFKVKIAKRSKQRISLEYKKICFFSNLQPKFHPTPINYNPVYGSAIYSWIEGNSIHRVNKRYLDNVVQYLKIINNNLNQKKKLNKFKASASCFSKKDIFLQINSRFNSFNKIKNNNLTLYLSSLREYFHNLKCNLKTSNNIYFPKKDLIISPSDLSIKNFIYSYNNEFFFIDYEYLGYDDSIKLICDTIIHPANKLNTRYAKYFVHEFNLKISPINFDRFKQYFPFYCLIWCLIILNPIKKNDLSRMKINATIIKSKKLFNKIKNKYTDEYINEITRF